MGLYTNPAVLNAALAHIATATTMVACSQQPTTRTEAITTYALADVALTGGDFSNSDSSGGGRKVTIAQKTNVDIDATGNATHVALVSASDLIEVNTCTTQSLTSGGTVTFPAWSSEFSGPTPA